jgi:hypothetical protein
LHIRVLLAVECIALARHRRFIAELAERPRSSKSVVVVVVLEEVHKRGGAAAVGHIEVSKRPRGRATDFRAAIRFNGVAQRVDRDIIA